jgi:hypothetical protein
MRSVANTLKPKWYGRTRSSSAPGVTNPLSHYITDGLQYKVALKVLTMRFPFGDLRSAIKSELPIQHHAALTRLMSDYNELQRNIMTIQKAMRKEQKELKRRYCVPEDI